MIEGVLLPLLGLLLAWKGLGAARPAAPGAETSAVIAVRTSRWTHALFLACLVASLLLSVHAVRAGGRSLLIILPIGLFFTALSAWGSWDLAQTFVIEADRLRVERWGCRDRLLPFSTITKIDVWAPYYIVDARFADGTRLTLHPFLHGADEGARRVLVGAPTDVVLRLEGPGGEAVRELRERNAAARADEHPAGVQPPV